MTAGLRFFYRHIHVTGLDNIPSRGPVIIIANHNSSLMDAALLGILLKRKAWFFARGDVFINKTVRRILWWLHMMPVHSHTGGRKTLGANKNSFSDGEHILSKGGIIVFFPESFSHVEHQLLPFRKGVFRLAFDTAAAQNFSTDIPIVPIGINYNHPSDSRTAVHVHAGKPLLLKNYFDEYRENAAAALLHICKDAHQAVEHLVLHVDDKQRLQTTGQQLQVCRNNYPAPANRWKIESMEQLHRERNICARINETERAFFENNKEKASSYFNALSAAGIADSTTGKTFRFPAWKTCLLWTGFPIYIIGLMLNALPVFIARQVADKKVYRQDFYSWIFVACYSCLYFFWMIMLLVTALFAGWIYGVGLPVVMISSGLFAYVYKGWLKDYHQNRRWQQLSPGRKNELIHMRTAMERSAIVPAATVSLS